MRLLIPGERNRSAPTIAAIGIAVVSFLLTSCPVRSSNRISAREPAAAPSQQPGPPGDEVALLLPDLRIAAPRQLYVTTDPGTGQRQIRFSTSISNVGRGPLEMTGRHDRASRRIIATQRILHADGEITTRVVGAFVFHPDHDHWHIEQFTSFELWTHAPDGTLQRMIATTGKMSFCVWDSDRMERRIAGAATRRMYRRCPQDVQGLSVGWTDVYRARTPGQHLSVEGISDGRYAIRSTVDPENRLAESNEANNHAIAYVRLSGSSVTRMPGPR